MCCLIMIHIQVFDPSLVCQLTVCLSILFCLFELVLRLPLWCSCVYLSCTFVTIHLKVLGPLPDDLMNLFSTSPRFSGLKFPPVQQPSKSLDDRYSSRLDTEMLDILKVILFILKAFSLIDFSERAGLVFLFFFLECVDHEC